MNEDQKTIAQAEDKMNQAWQRGYITWTPFLDSHQQAVLQHGLTCPEGMKMEFYGGYEDAERRILAFVPEGLDLEEEETLCIVRATRMTKGGPVLSHGDYLGSITGLGIRREVTGDILVREDGADIIVLSDMAKYILQYYCKAGRVELSAEQREIEELITPPAKKRVVCDTVASLRLDNILSSGFGIPRAKAVDAVRGGLVAVNHAEVTKADRLIAEGDLVSLRKSGRLRLKEIGGRSRKDRIYITMERYGQGRK